GAGLVSCNPSAIKKFMMQLKKAVLLLLALLALLPAARAFSLLGPFKAGASPNDWQGRGFGGRPWGLGYTLDFDIGGPMTFLEGFRWYVPIITYGFDQTFLQYFGLAGVAAVSNAFQILMDLPAFTEMSADLSEFPMDMREQNYRAAALGLLDVKS